MITKLKFPFKFDVGKVLADLDRLAPDEWTPHFNTQYYEGDWSGIALRSADSSHIALYPDPTAERYVDTDAMARCISVREILEHFECETESVRFLRLGPGASIKKHKDYRLSLDDGIARVHVPVKTSPDVEFYLNDERISMNAGEAWYLNFNLYHSVVNPGGEPRIHLVIDCVVNDWFRGFFKSK